MKAGPLLAVLLAATSILLAACVPASAIERLEQELRSRLSASATPDAVQPEEEPRPGDSPRAAIRLVIYRANFEQEQAIASRDSSAMKDTSTDSYFEEMAQLNQRLLEGGVTRIRLVGLEWGPITITGNTAVATTYETWTTSFANGTRDRSTDRNVYHLIRQGGAWKIQANEHPDEPQRRSPGGTQVRVLEPLAPGAEGSV